MQIVRMDQSKYIFDDGLDPVNLDRLSRIVVLAGPNGAGKTRLLNRVSRLMGTSTDNRGNLQWELHFGQLDSNTQKIRINLETSINSSSNHHHNKALLGVWFTPHDGNEEFTRIPVADFSTADTNLEDPDELQGRQIRERAEMARYLGGHRIPNATLPYIHLLQTGWREATHSIATVSNDQVREVINRYEQMQKLISSLIGVDLGRDLLGRPTLFDRAISEAHLSEGQKCLLKWAVILHAQGIDLATAIVTIDEPENHLHPDVQIETVDRIIRAAYGGQIWIGTHSLPLIAAIQQRFSDELSLFFMDSGRLSFAGRNPEKVLVSLMGGDVNVSALREFIDLPETLATNHFAAECLLPPSVIAHTQPNDPQNTMIAKQVLADSGSPRCPKVLDFGAGHGRLISGLSAILDDETAQRINYVAFDRPGSDQSSDCRAVLERCYPNETNRWFNDRQQLFARHNPGSFDYVVMCNVLHEIDPKDWTSLFDRDGIVCRALSSQGQLLIVEDYLMPKGEYAHPYGFIVLSTDSLKALFQIDGSKTGIEVLEAEGKYAGRIRAHLVSHDVLPNVTAESRKQALQLAARNAEEQIAKLRQSSNHDFRSGQAHAFWVQQFANATLAYKAL